MLSASELAVYGVDVRAGLAHMDNNEALYARFLAMFPKDDSVLRMAKALENGDAAEAFSCAHALKGLCAQLGIARLASLAGELCELLRHPQGDALVTARERFALLQRAHRQALRGIARL